MVLGGTLLHEGVRGLEVCPLNRMRIGLPVPVLVEVLLLVAVVLGSTLLHKGVRGLEVCPLNRMRIGLPVPVLVEVLLLVAVAVILRLRTHDRADKQEEE